jgi:hypothetical protein
MFFFLFDYIFKFNFISFKGTYVFDSRPGLCIIPDSPHIIEDSNNNNVKYDDTNSKTASFNQLNQLLPRIRNNSTTIPSTSSSRSSSLASIESISENESSTTAAAVVPIDFTKQADDSVQLVFKSTLSDEKEIEWKASLINETNLYVDIPVNHLTEGTRDSFVSLLEFAEDKLECERVFVVLNKSRADRASLMNVFRFFGFKAVAPGNKYISQNEDVITMVYEIEQ